MVMLLGNVEFLKKENIFMGDQFFKTFINGRRAMKMEQAISGHLPFLNEKQKENNLKAMSNFN